MRKHLLIAAICLALILIWGCVVPPDESLNEAEVFVFGLYPADGDEFTIFSTKSKYNRDTYDYVDSVLFIRIDTSGNHIGTSGFDVPYRPNIMRVFHLANNHLLIYGNMFSYYYSNSAWEYDLSGQLIRELDLPDAIYGITPSYDGNYFVFGWQDTDEYWDDILYMKTDNTGDTLWSRTIPSGSFNVSLNSGEPLSDNGCIALGRIWMQDRSYDMLVARITALGDTLWTRTYGGDRFDEALMARELSDGNILLVGELNLYDSTNTDWSLNSGQQVYLVKISPAGETLWTRAIGNTLRESPNNVIEASDGNIILLGTREESYAYLYDETIGWVSKISSAGEELWLTEFESMKPMGVHELSTGEFLIATNNIINNYQYAPDMNIIKLSSSGTVIWNRTLTP